MNIYFKVSLFFFWIAIILSVALYNSQAQSAEFLSSNPETLNLEIGDSFKDPETYITLYYRLALLHPQDTVILHLHSVGGNSLGLAYLMWSLKNSPAHVIARIDSPTFSAGAMITCIADKIEMSPYSFLMFHNGSTTAEGKVSDVTGELKNHNRLFDVLMLECTKRHILTRGQVDDITNGKDIYIHPGDNANITTISGKR